MLTNGSATYQLDFTNSLTATDRQELTKMAMAVVERRVNALEGKALNVTPGNIGDTVALTVKLDKAGLADDLTQSLGAPFTFRLVEQATQTDSDTFTIGELGLFRETAFREKHITSVEWAKDPANGKGAANIQMNADGAQLFQSIAKRNAGKTLGILVRGVLVSTTKAQEDQDKLVIRNIPTPEMAQVFADDVNVGLHVTFTPVD